MTAPALPDLTNRDYYIGLSRERGAQYALDVAIDDVAKLRTAIARALGGDGEPVAWAIRNPKMSGHILIRTEAEARAVATMDGDYIVPLYTRPAATGDTGEVEKARAELSAALARLTDDERAVLPLNVQEDARPRVRLAHIEAGEGAQAGQGTAVVSVPAKYARLAWAMVCAINAATGGPDAR